MIYRDGLNFESVNSREKYENVNICLRKVYKVVL